MFKQENFEEELAFGMQEKLISNAIDEKNIVFNKFARAIDCLNIVASLFDELGLVKEAEFATQLLEAVSNKKSHEDPTSEKMVKNLKEKGWVFDEDCDDAKDEVELPFKRNMDY